MHSDTIGINIMILPLKTLWQFLIRLKMFVANEVAQH